jgi:protein TonB
MRKNLCLLLFIVCSLVYAQHPKSQDKITSSSINYTDSTIYDVFDVPPSYPGGLDSLYAFINRTIKYPPESNESGNQGKTFVSFIVNKDGTICDVKIIKTYVNKYLDAEAIRIVKLMSKWIPGEISGKKVRTRFVLPVVFKLR